MKPRSIIVRCFIGVLLLASPAAAQFSPTISSIPSLKAFAPGRLVVRGTLLDFVTEVRVNGTPIPILSSGGSRLVAGPLAPQPPGFATVRLVFRRGSVTGRLELTPTVQASRRGLRVTTIINNGDVGAFALRFSYTRLGALEVDPGIYFGRLIPMDSSTLVTGVLEESAPTTVVARLPIEIGLVGAELHLQALCTVGAAGVQSYSNLAIVPPFGPFAK